VTLTSCGGTGTPPAPGPVLPASPEIPTSQPTTPDLSIPTSPPSGTPAPPTTSSPPISPIPCPTPSANTLERFWKASDSWNEATKEVEFRFKVTDDNPERYALVNFIKGYGKWLTKEDGRYGYTQMFGEVVDDNFPNWSIDSLDEDPVYWSNSSARWNYFTIGADTASAVDKPSAPIGYQISADFKMCIYEIDSIPIDGKSVNADILMRDAIECIDWEAKVTHNDDGTITYP
jgi:hypothetical protein